MYGRSAAVKGPSAPRLWAHAGPAWACPWITFAGLATARSLLKLAEELADARDDLAAVQLDVGDELVVCQARHAVFQVEPGGA